jgi:hypothetical protein
MADASSPSGVSGHGRLAEMLAARGGQAAPEAPSVIEHREALIYMLCEAAELEHGIMCQYLFGAASLKQREQQGLTPRAFSRFVTLGTSDADIAPRGETAEPPGPDEPLGFERHIKPLFRERDRTSMRFRFDLWSFDDVSTHADAILRRLDEGTMPCDGAWPADRIAVFRRWIDVGKPSGSG